MKKALKILTVVCLVALVVTLSACANKLEGIYFSKPPRATFVQGQELDLTGAELVANFGKSEESVDLSLVQVSGYDKDTLGEQTVTFTYEEKTVTLKVNVIPRVAVEGVVTDYFIGDKFDKTKGRIKVADDNGNITTVSFSEDSVTVEGFDSKTQGAGKQELTVKYGDYSGKVTVTIHEAGKVEFTDKPSKNMYYSHNTLQDIVVTGSALTVTSKDGTFSKKVDLAHYMIKGFDPTVATVENVTNAKAQTLKIEYLGNTFDFPITIKYSGVSYMKDVGAKIGNASAADAALAYGEESLNAIAAYLKLFNAEKDLVPTTVKNAVASTAAYYGMEQFNAAMEAYKTTFSVEPSEGKNGQYGFTYILLASDYETVQNDLEKIKDPKAPVLDIVDKLLPIRNEFGGVSVKGTGQSISRYMCTVFDRESLGFLTDMLEVLVDLYVDISVVPDDWKIEDLEQYGPDIKSAVVTISAADYNPFRNSAFVALYNIANTWREKDDLFDIIYSYYIEYEPENLINDLWEKVVLPDKLLSLYSMISYGISSVKNMSTGDDTTAFMYYYYRAKEISEDIKANGSELHKKIYDNIGFDSMINHYFFVGDRVNSYAYVYYVASLLDDKEYEDLMDILLSLVDNLSGGGTIDYKDADNQAKIKEILNIFVNMSPSKRTAFLESLHLDAANPAYATDDRVLSTGINKQGKKAFYNLFASIVIQGYDEMLTAEGSELFGKLLVAFEEYSLRYRYTNAENNALENFYELMDEINTKYSTLAASDKALLDFALDSANALYSESKNPANPDVSDYQDKFDELRDVISVFYEFYNYAQSNSVLSDQKYAYYTVSIAAYERAKSIVAELFALDNAAVNHTYMHNLVDFTIVDGANTRTVTLTYEYMLADMGKFINSYRLVKDVIYLYDEEGDEHKYIAFDLYYGTTTPEFLELAYEIILTEARKTLSGDAAEFDAQQVVAVLTVLSNMKKDDIYALKALQFNVLSFGGLKGFIEDEYSEDVAEVLALMLDMIENCGAYVTEPTAVTREALSDAIDALKAAYEALDKTNFTDFEKIYESTLETCEKILEEAISNEDPNNPPETSPDDDGTLDPDDVGGIL